MMTRGRTRARTHLLLAGGLIVIAGTGCDNVAWGGASLDLRSPALPDIPPDSELIPDLPADPVLPAGELLFFITLDRGSANAIPLGFVNPEGASELPPIDNPRYGPLLQERLESVKELTLFREGNRAGTMIVSGPGDPDRFCPTLPRLQGTAELRQDLGEISDDYGYLAMPRSDRFAEHGDVRPPPARREVRGASLTMAGNLINEVGAVWPPSVLGIRRDIRLFRAEEGLGVAASFLYRDQLDTGAPPAGSYSIFVLGEERPDSIHATYTDFHRSGTDGKLAPRLIGQLDWDGDGEDEVALALLSQGRRGFRLLDRAGDVFVDALEVGCGVPE
ncbi:MAG: hypothetical protein ACR2QM_05460 [Longimicrobiales bacterium]